MDIRSRIGDPGPCTRNYTTKTQWLVTARTASGILRVDENKVVDDNGNEITLARSHHRRVNEVLCPI
ncbi:hypothetical protein BDW72DRAFT_178947 [Aspergillus terricola var. indicus]